MPQILITQHSYWTPRSPKALFQLCHSRILWFTVTTLQSLRLTERTDGVADGKEGEGTGVPPSPTPKPSQESVLVPLPPGPSTGPGKTLSLSLSQLETILSLSLPGTAKSDKVSGPPQGLAWLPPASQEAVASQAAPEGSKIGSALQQLTLSSPASTSTLHMAPGPNSAHLHWGPMPHFPCPAAHTAGPIHLPHASTASPFGLHNLCCEIDPSVCMCVSGRQGLTSFYRPGK